MESSMIMNQTEFSGIFGNFQEKLILFEYFTR